MDTIISRSPEETFDYACAFAASLSRGDLILLEGDLGAGKTQWVKGLAAGLDCESEVTSPTFTLMHEYRGPGAELVHIDLYRLEEARELEALSLEECANRICVIEWPKFSELSTIASWRRIFHVRVTEIDDGSRKIEVSRR